MGEPEPCCEKNNGVEAAEDANTHVEDGKGEHYELKLLLLLLLFVLPLT